MINRLRALLLAAALTTGLLASPANAQSHTYQIDETHLAVAFLVRHIGYADTLGQFLKASGSFVFDEETRELSDIRVEIDAASVFSNHKGRDKHIRGKDFLWAGEHPTISFIGTGAEPTGERTGKVHGDLTIRGQTKPVTLDVVWNKSGAYPFGKKHHAIGISARTSIKRSDFGMTYALAGDLVGDKVDIILEFEAIRGEPVQN